ncbi:MAG: hypothetical protein Q9O62_09595 [Ardenticatenia bacterium]|nr:hypothetical protein [Ardenticatenia bacterium]
MSNFTSDELLVGIAGLRFRLYCPDSALMERLAHLYRPFLVPPDDQPPHLVAEVVLTSPLAVGAPVEPALRFEHGRLHLNGPGTQGWVDAAGGVGRLVLNTPYAVAHVEHFLRASCALVTFETGGLLIHAAGVVRHGRAHLFFGPSGSGKTTVARFAGADDTVLSDDLVVICPQENGWRAYATPFVSSAGQWAFRPTSARVASLFRLVQSDRVAVVPLSPARAVAELVANAPVVCADPSRSAPLLHRCVQLATQIPPHALLFRHEPSFWNAVDKIPR